VSREFVVLVNDDRQALICEMDGLGWGVPPPDAVLISLVGDGHEVMQISDEGGVPLGIASSSAMQGLESATEVFIGCMDQVDGFSPVATVRVTWV